MRVSIAGSHRIAVACYCGLVCVGLCWLLGRTLAGGGEVKAGEGGSCDDAAKSDVPWEHAALYEKLRSRRIQIDFQEQPIDDALKTLATALEAPIELDRSELEPERFARKLTLKIEEPISLRMALYHTLQFAALHDMEIALEPNGVRIIGPKAAAERYVLRWHDLRAASDYTTALRSSTIEQIQQRVTPNDWQRAAGPWIGLGTSVFTIDVYHKPEAHLAISKWWYERFARQQYSGGWGFEGDGAEGKKKASPEELAKTARELREKYPFKSLAKRLDYETGKADAAQPLAPHVEQKLAERDKRKTGRAARFQDWNNLRTASLMKLHSDEVAKFISREGFGMSRMPQPSPSFLPLAEPPLIALPSAEIDPPSYAEVPVQVPKLTIPATTASFNVPSLQQLLAVHMTSEQQFLSPFRLGYAKDRDHVAGFGGHAFSELPRLEEQFPWYSEPAEQWATRRMELMSLLKHDAPRVYRSDRLPRMDELATAETRGLNGFEAAALEKLQASEDVVTRATTNRIEMLGSLRASQDCLKCHQVTRGQLLGAFSYTLVRDPLVRAAE